MELCGNFEKFLNHFGVELHARRADDLLDGLSVSHESIWVSESLTGQRVGLEPVQETHYRLWFRDLDLGTVELPVPNVVIDSVVQMHLDKKKTAG